MDESGNFRNFLLKYAESVGISHHHAGNLIVEKRLEVGNVNSAVGSTFHFHNLESAHSSRGWICAVSRIWNDDFCAFRVTTTFVIGLDGHQARQFTVRTGVRIERELAHPSYFGKRLLNQALEEFSLNLRKVPAEAVDAVVRDLGMRNEEELYEKIGLGERVAPFVARRLLPEDTEATPDTPAGPLAIAGTEGLLVTYARCCFPIPNDPILANL